MFVLFCVGCGGGGMGVWGVGCALCGGVFVYGGVCGYVCVGRGCGWGRVGGGVWVFCFVLFLFLFLFLFFGDVISFINCPCNIELPPGLLTKRYK